MLFTLQGSDPLIRKPAERPRKCRKSHQEASSNLHPLHGIPDAAAAAVAVVCDTTSKSPTHGAGGYWPKYRVTPAHDNDADY